MTRRCSHCNTNGHNNRTCTGGGGGGGGGGVRLFGVRLTNGSFIKKSASMGNILSHHSATSDLLEGYHSDDLDHSFTARRRPIRKKGVPWTEQEHRQFLIGLQKLGRGNWRGISRNYVRTRTPTQVASHAQKYFIHQSNGDEPGKRKRPSLFDLVPDTETNSSKPEQSSIPSPAVDTDNRKLMFSSTQAAYMHNSLPYLDLSLKPAFTHSPFQLRPPNAYSLKDCGAGTSQIHKTAPVVQEEPMTELVGMSQLTLGETGRLQIESPPFSLRVPGNP